MAVGCGTTEILLASYHPSSELTKGLPRLAQNEVKVIIDQSEKVGEVSGVAGYFLVPESELLPLLKAAKELQELKGVK